jgi:hypothetical protein
MGIKKIMKIGGRLKKGALLWPEKSKEVDKESLSKKFFCLHCNIDYTWSGTRE